MLQKTLLNIEGLGRQLDPDLDLWTTAKPFLENWMREQIGLKGLLRALRNEAPRWATMLPQLPRLDRKSTRLNSSHLVISYAVFCLKKKKQNSNLVLHE